MMFVICVCVCAYDFRSSHWVTLWTPKASKRNSKRDSKKERALLLTLISGQRRPDPNDPFDTHQLVLLAHDVHEHSPYPTCSLVEWNCRVCYVRLLLYHTSCITQLVSHKLFDTTCMISLSCTVSVADRTTERPNDRTGNIFRWRSERRIKFRKRSPVFSQIRVRN